MPQETMYCHHCKEKTPYRSNKKFCSAKCRNTTHQKETRKKFPRNASSSPTERRQQSEDYDLMKRLSERLYMEVPPRKRLGFVEEVIQLARSGKCPALRRVLTNPAFIKPDRENRGLFPRRSPCSYMTFPQAAQAYCEWFWDAGLKEVVRSEVQEPPTGEVCPAEA